MDYLLNNLGIDYRIVDFKNSFLEYQFFLNDLKLRKSQNQNNEFEVKEITEEELFEAIGFEPKSVIVLFVPYLTDEKLKANSNISIHGQSIDYHIIVKKIATKVLFNLKLDNEKSYIQCDTGLLNERFYGIYSGIGKQGINQMVINDIYGSYGFLSLILVDHQIPEIKNQRKNCIGCGKCIKICPGNAITKDFFDSNSCISYLTQKKELTYLEEEKIKNNGLVYGCDRCQSICPENNDKKYSNIEDFTANLLYNIKLEDIKNLTNKGFKLSFGNRNFAWRGKSLLIRNLEILER